MSFTIKTPVDPTRIDILGLTYLGSTIQEFVIRTYYFNTEDGIFYATLPKEIVEKNEGPMVVE